MSKVGRGTKRICKSCEAKFYDLNRDPIVCPSCGTPFLLDAPAVDDDLAEVEAVAVVAEPAAKPAPAAAEEPEFISLEEADAEAAGDDTADDDDELVDLGDDAAEIPDDDSEDAFLEQDEEPETDVSGIIGEPIKPDNNS